MSLKQTSSVDGTQIIVKEDEECWVVQFYQLPGIGMAPEPVT